MADPDGPVATADCRGDPVHRQARRNLQGAARLPFDRFQNGPVTLRHCPITRLGRPGRVRGRRGSVDTRAVPVANADGSYPLLAGPRYPSPGGGKPALLDATPYVFENQDVQDQLSPGSDVQLQEGTAISCC